MGLYSAVAATGTAETVAPEMESLLHAVGKDTEIKIVVYRMEQPPPDDRVQVTVTLQYWLPLDPREATDD